MTDTICTRFADIPSNASLTIKTAWIEVGGQPEEWVALDVDGQPFAGLPREGFLDSFHRALHEMTEGETDD